MNNQNNNKQEPFNIVYTIKKKAVNRISYRIMGFVFLMVVAFQIFSMINGFSKHIVLTGIFAVILAFYGFYLVKMSFRKQAFDITYTFNEEGFLVKHRYGEKLYKFDDIDFVTMVIADENLIYYMLNVKTKKEAYPIPFTMQGALCEKVYDFMNARIKHDDDNTEKKDDNIQLNQ